MVLIVGAALNISWNFHEDKKQAKKYSELIRFHVIANSDSDEDQELKLKVRNILLEKIEPELGRATTLEEAKDFIANNLDYLEEIAEKEIEKRGYDYSTLAVMGSADYPTRSYGDLILPAGTYQSLRITIGDGKGSNWWCVLFPPLCFVDITSSIVEPKTLAVSEVDEVNKKANKTFKIKFKLLEIIKDRLK
ncbi:MAG: hypothetical protein APF76_05410 [Desulfitibacter sp. BRH_c19]|nr:MAG: hypothetical protein APF76_05410 [Desulfitibacter sp. BRH_c19]